MSGLLGPGGPQVDCMTIPLGPRQLRALGNQPMTSPVQRGTSAARPPKEAS